MKNSRHSAERPQFLSGWKDIANYLGKGVRTVQRYERELGLPVRRPAGKTTGSVVATKAELDAWITASPIREAFHLTNLENRPATGMTASIKSGITEMVRLREQMTALRNEVRTSVELLRQGLHGLQGDLHLNSSAWRRSLTVLEASQRNSYIMDLLESVPTRKAS
jgi:hypothetical protein